MEWKGVVGSDKGKNVKSVEGDVVKVLVMLFGYSFVMVLIILWFS